jgi:hypothetical protein
MRLNFRSHRRDELKSSGPLLQEKIMTKDMNGPLPSVDKRNMARTMFAK